MPSDFFINQADYEVLYQEAAEIEAEFEATDLLTYSSFANDSMVYDYSSIFDADDAPQWTTAVPNRYVEVWWGLYVIPDVGTLGPAIQVLDTEEREFLGYKYYVALEPCRLTVNDEYIGIFLLDTQFKTDYGSQYNVTVKAVGSYVSANLIIKANGTDTLSESIDNGVLLYSITWEIDFDAMKPNVFMLLAQMLTFQSPDWGIPGLLGEILSYIIGLGFWATIILIVYAAITKLLPTASGGLEN